MPAHRAARLSPRRRDVLLFVSPRVALAQKLICVFVAGVSCHFSPAYTLLLLRLQVRLPFMFPVCHVRNLLKR